MAERQYAEEDIFQKGFASAAMAAGASQGQIASVGPLPDREVTWTEPGGGGQQEFELTVDKDSADGAYHTFDLGGFAFVSATATLLAADPDGEPYGGDAGQIVFDIEGITRTDDLDSTAALSGASQAWEHDHPFEYLDFDGPLPALSHQQIGNTSRYVTFKAVIFIGFDNGDGFYAGPNNPTATWRIEVEYR